MNDIWSTYFNMFEKSENDINKIKHLNKTSIINEDSDQDWNDQDDQPDQEESESQEQNNDNSNDQSISDKEESENKGANLKFSADLAAEFGNTCNKFTNIAAKVVKERTVNKQTADSLTKILDKLKSLIDAANNSI